MQDIRSRKLSTRTRARRSAIALAALAAGTAAFTGAAQAVTVQQFSIADPSAIATGPDGNVWFSDPYDGLVGRITPAGNVVQYGTGGYDLALTAGPDGNVWGANEFGGVERITPNGGITDFNDDYDMSASITTGSDGNIWFSSGFNNEIKRITPAGAITTFPLPDGADPGRIVSGPDGSLWFNEAGNKIGRISTGGRLLSSFANPGGTGSVLAADATGVWFTDGSAIGHMAANGTVAQLTDLPAGDVATGIATSPDGNVWFTSASNDHVGRIAPNKSVTDYDVPQSAPTQIAVGHDDALYFIESGNRIGRLMPDDPQLAYLPMTGISEDAGTLHATVDANGFGTSAYFEYGTTTAYGATTTARTVHGDAPIPIAVALTGLQPGTTYHYRLVASSSQGTTTGPDETFTTAQATASPSFAVQSAATTAPAAPASAGHPAARAAKLTLVTRKTTVASSGKAVVTLACSTGAGRCTGMLTLTAPLTGKAASAKAGKHPRTTLARTRFSVPAGKTVKVELKLGKAARARLAAAKHHRLAATATASTNASAASHPLALAAARR